MDSEQENMPMPLSIYLSPIHYRRINKITMVIILQATVWPLAYYLINERTNNLRQIISKLFLNDQFRLKTNEIQSVRLIIE